MTPLPECLQGSKEAVAENRAAKLVGSTEQGKESRRADWTGTQGKE